MTTNSIVIIILSTIALFSTVYGANNTECKTLLNPSCETCLKYGNCAFCKTTKVCFQYNGGNVLSPDCNTSDMQWQTCVGNFRVWIIIVSILAGVVLIAILITIWCFCRKCKRRRIRKEERRQDRDDQRMEERRAAAAVRSDERTRVADQIRMKYGILKANDNSTDYTRMS